MRHNANNCMLSGQPCLTELFIWIRPDLKQFICTSDAAASYIPIRCWIQSEKPWALNIDIRCECDMLSRAALKSMETTEPGSRYFSKGDSLSYCCYRIKRGVSLQSAILIRMKYICYTWSQSVRYDACQDFVVSVQQCQRPVVFNELRGCFLRQTISPCSCRVVNLPSIYIRFIICSKSFFITSQAVLKNSRHIPPSPDDL